MASLERPGFESLDQHLQLSAGRSAENAALCDRQDRAWQPGEAALTSAHSPQHPAGRGVEPAASAGPASCHQEAPRGGRDSPVTLRSGRLGGTGLGRWTGTGRPSSTTCPWPLGDSDEVGRPGPCSVTRGLSDRGRSASLSEPRCLRRHRRQQRQHREETRGHVLQAQVLPDSQRAAKELATTRLKRVPSPRSWSSS